MELLKGLGICLLVITIIKFVHYQYFRGKNKDDTPDKFDIKFWFKDNWMDYFINVGVSFVVFLYQHDSITAINVILEKLGSKYRMIHFEDSGFYFVIIPIIISVVVYKFLRKKAAKPIQNKVRMSFTGGGGDLPPDQDEDINP